MRCDCEAPSAFRQVARRARVEHQCCECSAVIITGQYYDYASGVWDGRAANFSTCVPCAAMREFFQDTVEEGVPFGHMVSWIHEFGWSELTRLVANDESARYVGRALGLRYRVDIHCYDIQEMRAAAWRRGQAMTIEQAQEVVGW